jgi:hypothetical protein
MEHFQTMTSNSSHDQIESTAVSLTMVESYDDINEAISLDLDLNEPIVEDSLSVESGINGIMEINDVHTVNNVEGENEGNELCDDSNKDAKDKMWELRKVMGVSELVSRRRAMICSTESCSLRAVFVYDRIDDSDVSLSLCLDCQVCF